MRSLSRICLWLCVLASARAAPLSAEDFVTVRQPDRRAPTRLSGEIVDFNEQRLLLRRPGDREETVESARVVTLETPLEEAHRRANELFAQRQWEPALASYQVAERSEKRPWMTRRIQARMVWCQRNLGQLPESLRTFLTMINGDPTLQYLDAAPVIWVTSPLTPAAERLAGELLTERTAQLAQQGSAAAEAARLIAASWLLPTTQRPAALQALSTLTQSRDVRIAIWAEAQAWRTSLVTVKPATVSQWHERVQQLPADLQPGPAFLLGQALSRVDRHDEAALWLLRAPILQPLDSLLNPQALLAAGRELETMGTSDDAAGLYREILELYGESPAASAARQRLGELATP